MNAYLYSDEAMRSRLSMFQDDPATRLPIRKFGQHLLLRVRPIQVKLQGLELNVVEMLRQSPKSNAPVLRRHHPV